MPELVAAFALAAVVLTVSALASGIVERAPLSFPIIFLGFGFLIGERGFGLLTLALVLFLDAVRMEAEEVRGAGLVPVLSLGPGTLIIISVVALGANLLLGTSLVESLLLGTVLASTDPVVLRDVVRNERIPRSVRRALSIEAGANDIVVLPILLVLIAVANAEAASAAGWATLLAQVLLLGPLVGFAVGAVGAWLMAKADAAFGISREYQALFGIGLVLLAYAGAQSLGGDGFLAAFAAGFAVAVLNDEQGQKQRVQSTRSEPPDERPRGVAHGGTPEDQPDSQRAGNEDHHHRQDEHRDERNLEGDLRDHDPEEDEREEHGHLGRCLAVVQEAVAQVEVQNGYREPRGERGQKAVPA